MRTDKFTKEDFEKTLKEVDIIKVDRSMILGTEQFWEEVNKQLEKDIKRFKKNETNND